MILMLGLDDELGDINLMDRGISTDETESWIHIIDNGDMTTFMYIVHKKCPNVKRVYQHLVDNHYHEFLRVFLQYNKNIILGQFPHLDKCLQDGDIDTVRLLLETWDYNESLVHKFDTFIQKLYTLHDIELMNAVFEHMPKRHLNKTSLLVSSATKGDKESFVTFLDRFNQGYLPLPSKVVIAVLDQGWTDVYYKILIKQEGQVNHDIYNALIVHDYMDLVKEVDEKAPKVPTADTFHHLCREGKMDSLKYFLYDRHLKLPKFSEMHAVHSRDLEHLKTVIRCSKNPVEYNLDFVNAAIKSGDPSIFAYVYEEAERPELQDREKRSIVEQDIRAFVKAGYKMGKTFFDMTVVRLCVTLGRHRMLGLLRFHLKKEKTDWFNQEAIEGLHVLNELSSQEDNVKQIIRTTLDKLGTIKPPSSPPVTSEEIDQAHF